MIAEKAPAHLNRPLNALSPAATIGFEPLSDLFLSFRYRSTYILVWVASSVAHKVAYNLQVPRHATDTPVEARL